MGKAAKEHRKKVAKRNAKIKQEKAGMQKAFDMLLQQQLEKLKVDVIEAGFAASSPGDWDGVNLIAKNIQNSTIASLARCVPDDIEKAWEAIKVANKSRIHVFTSTSDIHMEHMLRNTKEENFLVGVCIYLACRESDELPRL